MAETCDPENATQGVTYAEVEGAHVSDPHAVVPVIDALEEKDCTPEALLADTNDGRSPRPITASAGAGTGWM